jgi:hypothetical protein
MGRSLYKRAQRQKKLNEARQRENLMKDVQGAHLLDAPGQQRKLSPEEEQQMVARLEKIQMDFAKPCYDQMAADYLIGVLNLSEEERKVEPEVLREFRGLSMAAAAIWMEGLGLVEFEKKDEDSGEGQEPDETAIPVDEEGLTEGGIALG